MFSLSNEVMLETVDQMSVVGIWEKLYNKY